MTFTNQISRDRKWTLFWKRSKEAKYFQRENWDCCARDKLSTSHILWIQKRFANERLRPQVVDRNNHLINISGVTTLIAKHTKKLSATCSGRRLEYSGTFEVQTEQLERLKKHLKFQQNSSNMELCHRGCHQNESGSQPTKWLSWTTLCCLATFMQTEPMLNAHLGIMKSAILEMTTCLFCSFQK